MRSKTIVQSGEMLWALTAAAYSLTRLAFSDAQHKCQSVTALIRASIIIWMSEKDEIIDFLCYLKSFS